LRAWEALQKLRKIIEVFALEPVRRPAARSFSEEGEILSESLVRILTGLNRDLEGLLRATAAMGPYFGENPKDEKFPHLLPQLNKALDVQVRSAEQVRAVISQVCHRDF
jgi:HEAT repeat protein